MRALFVCSGDKNGDPKDVVRNQGSSLKKNGIDVSYFCVKGNGVISYIRSIPRLRKTCKELNPDIVHAHYSYSGFLAWIAGAGPLVVSFMGSDAMKEGLFRFFTRLLGNRLCKLAIVKSHEMKRSLKLHKAIIIPNGVDTDLFGERERMESYRMTGHDPSGGEILFIGDPARKEKNFELACKAVEVAGIKDLKLIVVNKVTHSELPWYYNSADLLLVTSLWEGSPNVVKEAMACNLPVVSTDVGDVRELLDGIGNSFICSNDPFEIAQMIIKVISERKRSNGREKIFRSGLDAKTIAERIRNEYTKISGIN